MKPPILNLNGKHRDWLGLVHLYPDGSFRGGVAAPDGNWRAEQDGLVLILDWTHWGSESLLQKPWGFEGIHLRLEFLSCDDVSIWRQLQRLREFRSYKSPRVLVQYSYGLGNNLFQFAAGIAIARRAGVPVSARPISGFPGTFAFNFGTAAHRPLDTRARHPMRIDFGACIEHLGSGGDVVVSGFHQRYEILRACKSELYDILMDIDVAPSRPMPSEDDLVVNVRMGDYFAPHLRDAYGYSLDDLLFLVRRLTFNELWVVTDSPDDPFIYALGREFSAQIGGRSALVDFEVMRRASRLVISPSTFAWWAAWLGQAKLVYFPEKRGIWSGSDIDLWVDDETRYIAY